MAGFLRRNAIFFLFPAVVVAIVFLGRFNITAAMSFGEWGERSIVESTLVLAREKVARIEQTITATDHTYFAMLVPEELDETCYRWREMTRDHSLVRAAAIVIDDGEGGEPRDLFFRDTDPNEAAKVLALIRDEILPYTDAWESLYQHKHLHRLIDGEYHLATALTDEVGDHFRTSVLLYDTDEVVGRVFEDAMGGVGPDRVLNIVDDDGAIIFGDELTGAGEFIVVQRFPSSLYKWKVQLAPLSQALFPGKAPAREYSQWMLITLSFTIIVFGLVVLYMAMVRERRLNRLKSEFIANTSHELKTPLALIRMFAELLSMGRVRDVDKVKRYNDIILRETERLTALIDNVLDFAKIERGKSAYDFRPMKIEDVVKPAIEIYSHRTAESGARLVFTVGDDIPLARIDGDAITLAVINLVDNAVKYAKGTDIVGVEIRADRGDVCLEVYDRGSGIPPHHQRRIFERFYRFQAEDLDTGGQRGSGIGLSLVKHIAKAHGGTVQVASTPGVETRFTIRIPALEGVTRPR